MEGISASGKTTWCRKHAPGCLVSETFPDDRHQQSAEGQKTAQYWTDWNARRWADAVEIERREGQCVCDTDPLKLHFLRSLWQIGEASEKQWRLQLATTETAIRDNKLGFADLYLMKTIDPNVVRRQKENDSSRVRDRFELHVRLQPALILWYQTLEVVLGSRVIWQLPDHLPKPQDHSFNPHRFNVGKFNEFISALS